MKTVYDRLLTSVTPLDLLEADENMTAFFYQPDSSFLKFGLAKWSHESTIPWSFHIIGQETWKVQPPCPEY